MQGSVINECVSTFRSVKKVPAKWIYTKRVPDVFTSIMWDYVNVKLKYVNSHLSSTGQAVPIKKTCTLPSYCCTKNRQREKRGSGGGRSLKEEEEDKELKLKKKKNE